MSATTIECPLCGSRYDCASNRQCPACAGKVIDLMAALKHSLAKSKPPAPATPGSTPSAPPESEKP